jgi:hypothetical protein
MSHLVAGVDFTNRPRRLRCTCGTLILSGDPADDEVLEHAWLFHHGAGPIASRPIRTRPVR